MSKIGVRPGHRNSAIALCAATLLLLWPALLNGFPLIFPDTGAYLSIAWGQYWTFDRSGFYGLALRTLSWLPAVMQLWVAIVIQAAAIAAVLLLALRAIVPTATPTMQIMVVAVMAVSTSLPWHSAQLMPDALTGICILLVWLAVSRDPGTPGTPLLWLAAVIAGFMHYTHLALVSVTAAAALACQAAWRVAIGTIVSRAIAALVATLAIFAGQIAANGLLLHHWSVAPAGSVFLFARLHEDGLIRPWLDRHCGDDGPAELCRIAPSLPSDSQRLLWDEESPVNRLVWQQFGSASAQRIVGQMKQASFGSIAEHPIAFAGTALRGSANQFGRFAALDDECPEVCGSPSSATYGRIRLHRPELLPRYLSSPQVRGSLPKTLLRTVSTAVALVSLVALLLVIIIAARRRDERVFGLSVVVLTTLVANAALAGALSDVHDRYQSRIVWLAPYVVLLALLKWRDRLVKRIPHQAASAATRDPATLDGSK